MSDIPTIREIDCARICTSARLDHQPPGPALGCVEFINHHRQATTENRHLIHHDINRFHIHRHTTDMVCCRFLHCLSGPFSCKSASAHVSTPLPCSLMPDHLAAGSGACILKWTSFLRNTGRRLAFHRHTKRNTRSRHGRLKSLFLWTLDDAKHATRPLAAELTLGPRGSNSIRRTTSCAPPSPLSIPAPD